MDIYFMCWIIIQFYYLFYCSSWPRFGPWDLFPVGSCTETPSVYYYFFFSISSDRGAWWATVHRVAKSGTRLSNLAQHTTPQFLFPPADLPCRCSGSFHPICWELWLFLRSPLCWMLSLGQVFTIGDPCSSSSASLPWETVIRLVLVSQCFWFSLILTSSVLICLGCPMG